MAYLHQHPWELHYLWWNQGYPWELDSSFSHLEEIHKGQMCAQYEWGQSHKLWARPSHFLLSPLHLQKICIHMGKKLQYTLILHMEWVALLQVLVHLVLVFWCEWRINKTIGKWQSIMKTDDVYTTSIIQVGFWCIVVDCWGCKVFSSI